VTVLGYIGSQRDAVIRKRVSDLRHQRVQANALSEYTGRWQIETMFGCLKVADLMRSKLHFNAPGQNRAADLPVGGLAVCLAVQNGRDQDSGKGKKKTIIVSSGAYLESDWIIYQELIIESFIR